MQNEFYIYSWNRIEDSSEFKILDKETFALKKKINYGKGYIRVIKLDGLLYLINGGKRILQVLNGHEIGNPVNLGTEYFIETIVKAPSSFLKKKIEL